MIPYANETAMVVLERTKDQILASCNRHLLRTDLQDCTTCGIFECFQPYVNHSLGNALKFHQIKKCYHRYTPSSGIWKTSAKGLHKPNSGSAIRAHNKIEQSMRKNNYTWRLGFLDAFDLDHRCRIPCRTLRSNAVKCVLRFFCEVLFFWIAWE